MFGFSKKPENKDFYSFFFNLSSYVASGHSVGAAIGDLAEDCDNKILKEAMLIVKSAIENDSETIAGAFSRSPIWPSFVVETLRGGEESGKLACVVKKIAQNIKTQGEVERSIKSALVSPKFVCASTVFVIFILAFFVIPKYEAMYASMRIPLPLFSVITFAFMKSVKNYWYLYFGMLLLCRYAWNKFCESYPETIDTWLLHLPFYNPFYYYLLQYRFAQMMALLWSAGQSPVDCLRYTAKAMGNRVYEKALLAAANNIADEACLLSTALCEINQDKLISRFTMRAISTGEVSGAMDNLLDEAEIYFHEMVVTELRDFSTTISIVFLFPAAVVVLALWISIVVPNLGLFNMKV